MKLYIDLSEYQPWSGAKDTYDIIRIHDKLHELDNLITAIYPEGLSITEFNDILWFDNEWILERLRIEDDDND